MVEPGRLILQSKLILQKGLILQRQLINPDFSVISDNCVCEKVKRNLFGKSHLSPVDKMIKPGKDVDLLHVARACQCWWDVFF